MRRPFAEEPVLLHALKEAAQIIGAPGGHLDRAGCDYAPRRGEHGKMLKAGWQIALSS